MRWFKAGTLSYSIGSLLNGWTFFPLLSSRPPCFQEKQCSSAWSPVHIPSADMIIFPWCKHTHTLKSVVAMASESHGSWWAPGNILSVQKPRGNHQNRPWNTERRFPKALHKHSLTHAPQAHELIKWLVSELTCLFKQLFKCVMQQLNI